MNNTDERKNTMKCPYKTLEISEDASESEIRAAYLAMAKRDHPDRHKGSSESHERFLPIQAAYETLSDPRERAKYDGQRRCERAGAERRRRDQEARSSVRTASAVPQRTDNGVPGWLFAIGGMAFGAALLTMNTKDVNGRFHGGDGKFRSRRWGP